MHAVKFSSAKIKQYFFSFFIIGLLYGISINALSPGVVLTNFHQERIQNKSHETGLSYEDQMEKEVANIPLRRHAKPQEVAQTIKFLLSEQSDFINGVNLVLDGGFTLSY